MEVKNAMVIGQEVYNILGDEVNRIFKIELHIGEGMPLMSAYFVVDKTKDTPNWSKTMNEIIWTVANTSNWMNEYVRIEIDNNKITRIGHILEDKWYPEREK